MEKVLKNLGLVLVILGAVLLCLTMIVPAMADMADQNWYKFGSVILIIVGWISHIVFNKYLPY